MLSPLTRAVLITLAATAGATVGSVTIIYFSDLLLDGFTARFDNYALGIGIPFVLASLFSGPFIRLMARWRSHMGTVEKVIGGSLVLTGVLFLTGGMPRIAGWLLETFPAFGTIG